jgi:predicted ATPase
MAMRITHLKLTNWRNFKTVDAPFARRMFIVGPNASGKSNLLDSIRFARDIARVGGGFQEAVGSRGGVHKVRCLAARNLNRGRVHVGFDLGDDDQPQEWSYHLDFSAERRGKHRPVLSEERIYHQGREMLSRPDRDDNADEERLTQTALEQVNMNREFREIADLLTSVRYRHLVPQVLREPERRAERRAEHDDDPFGADFLLQIARTPENTRAKRLKRINTALRLAVPQLDELQLTKDLDGTPHLEARYEHWRVSGARQDERDFSDGTLRLIGLLWSLTDTGKSAGPLLLEEPELSLNNAIVRQLPSILNRVQRDGGPQVIITTHAYSMFADEGVGLDEVLVLSTSADGTTAQLAIDNDDVRRNVESIGMSLEEAIDPLTRPAGVQQLRLLA